MSVCDPDSDFGRSRANQPDSERLSHYDPGEHSLCGFLAGLILGFGILKAQAPPVRVRLQILHKHGPVAKEAPRLTKRPVVVLFSRSIPTRFCGTSLPRDCCHDVTSEE
jgi:hypothetical protein